MYIEMQKLQIHLMFYKNNFDGTLSMFFVD